MWQQLRKPHIFNVYKSVINRTFLSDAYKCTEAWNSRLAVPLLQNVKLDTFYIDIEQKFNQQGKASAIDIDIYANSVRDDNHTDELADLLHRLRMTEETSSTLESTLHAVIRNLMENDNIELLINMLDDRLSYGLFLDSYTANLLLDKLIKVNDYKNATRIAIFQMLQEDLSNPITRSMSLLACYKYIQNPEPFEIPDETPKPAENAKKEEIKVRVKFIRNEFFDDHFDLKKSNHLVGKTLVLIGNEIKGSVGDSAKLFGLCLYEKYSEASKLLKYLQSSESEIYSEIVDESMELLKHLTDENAVKLLTEFEVSKSKLKLNKANFEETIVNLLKEFVAAYEQKDIDEQTKIYTSWIELRQQKLEDELTRLNRAERIKEIEKISKELDAEERKLWFFEKEEQIDLEIENKKVYYPKRWFGKKKKPRVIDEGYIPPEIRKNRN